MTSFYEGHDYYKKMLELQEKLRKSEEERIRLEERFKILVQESRNRHDACINRLRIRYIEFLEEQRTRDERNHKLLDALDRVDNSLALMTAKTNKLNVLRKQYETYLRRVYASRSPPGSITGNNDTTSQTEDKYLRRNAAAAQIHLPPEIKTISSAPMLLSNCQTSHTISPSTSRLTKSMQNMYYDNRHRDIPQPRALNQQPNDSQSTMQMHSLIQRNSIEQSPSQMLSSPMFQQKHPYYNKNHFQTDPSWHVPYASLDPQTNSSRQQAVPHFNEPSTQRIGTIQTASRFMVPEPTNGNIPSYKSLDVSQNRATPYYSNPPIIMEPFRQQTPEGLLSNLQSRLKNANELSPSFRTAAMMTGRNVSGASLSETPLHLSKQLLPSHVNYSPRNSEYCRRPNTNDPLYSLTTFDDDYMATTRQKCPVPKRLNSTRAGRLSMGMKQVLDEVDQSRATTITVENELDRYMEVIRKLNRDLDAESLEEIDHEQNTSGDVLNVTLSDDDLEAPTVDKSMEKLPKEVKKILALADDLASRSVNFNDARDPENGGKDENRNLESIRSTRSATPASDGDPATISGAREGRVTPMAYAKDGISSDIALQPPELDSHQNIGKPWERNDAGLHETRVMQQHEQQLPRMLEDERVGSVVSSNRITEENRKDTVVENVQREDYGGDTVCVAEESKVDQCAFDTVDELEEWSLDEVEKRVREIGLTEDAEELSLAKGSIDDKSESKEEDAEQIEPPNNVDTVENEADELEVTNVERIDSNEAEDQLQPQNAEVLQAEKDFVDKHEAETSEISTSQCQESVQVDENRDSSDKVLQNAGSVENKFDERKEYEEQKEEYSEIDSAVDAKQGNESELATQGEEYNDQNYVEEPNQLQNYAHDGEAEYANLNEEYGYDQNAPYENDQNQGYQEYANQEYAEGSNEQYEGYTSEQYDQYANVSEHQYEQDPNVQYQQDPNQDPNVQYQEDPNQDPNVQYQDDPNQEYAYTYDQQYDPNQVYETEVNQPFEYTETYDPNQTEVAQEQEGNAEEEQIKERKEPPEESKGEEMQETSEMVEANQSRNEKPSTENEPKKKKDVIKSLLDSDTDSTIERNVSNTESDFDFN